MYQLSIQDWQDWRQRTEHASHWRLERSQVPQLFLCTKIAALNKEAIFVTVTQKTGYTPMSVLTIMQRFFCALRPSSLLFNWIHNIFKNIQCLFNSTEDLRDECVLRSQSNEIISPCFLWILPLVFSGSGWSHVKVGTLNKTFHLLQCRNIFFYSGVFVCFQTLDDFSKFSEVSWSLHRESPLWS